MEKDNVIYCDFRRTERHRRISELMEIVEDAREEIEGMSKEDMNYYIYSHPELDDVAAELECLIEEDNEMNKLKYFK